MNNKTNNEKNLTSPRTFRDFVEKLRANGQVHELKKPIAKDFDMPGLMYELDGKPIYIPRGFVSGANSKFAAVGNVFSTRDLVCDYFGISKDQLILALMNSVASPSKPVMVQKNEAPVLENNTTDVDLSTLPIPIHFEKDGGPYLSSAIVIAKDKEYGQNMSFHRMMVIGKNRVVIRILKRHLQAFLDRNGGELNVAIVVGAPINVMLAAATSVELGQDEITFANTLAPVRMVTLDCGISIPADAEFAFEAKITTDLHDEGPFVDLTETYDVVRKQQVVEITKMYHRNDALWHVLPPGGLEHKVLMGMPREPTIFAEVSKVCECKRVNISPGGCSWLHAIVAIKKKHEDDGKKAIEAAFNGHKSLKHAIIVDEDIDIDNPLEVEWAIATRVQADRNVVIKTRQRGSSLDPSADPHTYETAKMGIDATKPLVAKGKNFSKAKWKKVKVSEYL